MFRGYKVRPGTWVAVIGIGILLGAAALWPVLASHSTRSWIRVPGQITAFNVSGPYPTKNGSLYSVSVRYSYTYNGKADFGEGVYLEGTDNISEAEYKRLSETYPLGKSVRIYVDPHDVSRTVLEQTYGEKARVLLSISGGWVCMGSAGLLWVLIRQCFSQDRVSKKT